MRSMRNLICREWRLERGIDVEAERPSQSISIEWLVLRRFAPKVVSPNAKQPLARVCGSCLGNSTNYSQSPSLNI